MEVGRPSRTLGTEEFLDGILTLDCALPNDFAMTENNTNKPIDDLAVKEAKPQLKRPPLFKVFLLNDDFTPMEFVIDILKRFFAMDEDKATQVMLHVHTRGIGVCGVYSRDIAETKVRQVNDFSREHQHPLLCDMDEA
jgi:ATP-dependent Clp protease adaptor protein ClpS